MLCAERGAFLFVTELCENLYQKESGLVVRHPAAQKIFIYSAICVGVLLHAQTKLVSPFGRTEKAPLKGELDSPQAKTEGFAAIERAGIS